jgi:NADH:ubiquinone oxidoreductase subunit E
MTEVGELIAKWGTDKEVLIEILHDIQARHDYLPAQMLEELASRLEIPKSIVYSVATYYNAFAIEPRGKHVVEVCTGTTCHVKGAPGILGAVERHTCCRADQTDKTGTWTVTTTRCVGACALAPVVVIDGETHGNVTQTSIRRILGRYDGSGNETGEPVAAEPSRRSRQR